MQKARRRRSEELGWVIRSLVFAASISCATLLGTAGIVWPQAKSEGPVQQKGNLVKNYQSEVFSYSPAGRRDPFKPLIAPKKAAQEVEEDLSKRPPLQRFDLSSLKLVGIIWGALGRHALVETPDGKGYLVAPKSLVGRNKGEVTAINEDNIIVEEKLTSPLGKIEKRTLVIKLRKKEG